MADSVGFEVFEKSIRTLVLNLPDSRSMIFALSPEIF